jgi:hypothetical protein
MRQLLAKHGFRTVRDEDLATVIHRLSLTVGTRRSATNGRVAIADR